MRKYENEIKEMRERGLSFTEIGKYLGISRQYAENTYKRLYKFTEKEKAMIDMIAYKNIRKFLYDNKMTFKEFCIKCGASNSTNSKFYNFMKGDKPGDIYMIRAILKVTGMTFEECFEE